MSSTTVVNNPSTLEIHTHLQGLADAKIAQQHLRFFKTGVGDYGEGDQFLGIRVPVLRKLIRQYQGIAPAEVIALLHSPFHEERLFALLLWVKKFQQAAEAEQVQIFDLYLSHTSCINNWDLVDNSAYQIVGTFLADKDRQPVYDLVPSPSLWDRRIAMIATFHWIRNHDFADALAIAQLLQADSEDLIHKAVGWMLREIGKRDIDREKAFLQEHYLGMPRTMLRYAIEKFPEPERQRYLQGQV